MAAVDDVEHEAGADPYQFRRKLASPDLDQLRQELENAGAAALAELTAIHDPGAKVLQAIARLSNRHVVAAPDDELALGGRGLGRPDLLHGQIRRPTRRIRSRTSRTCRRLTGSERPSTITVCTLPVTENSVMCLSDTR